MWRKAVPRDAIKNPSMRCRAKLLDEDLSESRLVEGVLIGYRRNGNFLIGHNDSDDSCCLVASECEVWDELQAFHSAGRDIMPIGKTMKVLRGTGRTTRMLEWALQLAKSKKKVLVVMGGSVPLSYAVNRLYDVAEQECQDAICKRAVNGQPETHFQFDWPQGGSLVLVGSVNVHFHEKGGFECDLLRGRQFDEVLYDHHAIEKQTPWIVKMLHAFDPDMQPIIETGSR